MRAAQLQVLGGTMAQVPADATAFTHRASRIMSTSPRSTRGPRTRPPAGLGRPVAAALGQEDSSAYVGFLGDEGRAHPPGLSAGHLAAAGSRSRPLRLSEPVPPQPQHPRPPMVTGSGRRTYEYESQGRPSQGVQPDPSSGLQGLGGAASRHDYRPAGRGAVTTGRRSGKQRSTMLAAPIVEDGRLVLVASYGAMTGSRRGTPTSTPTHRSGSPSPARRGP